MISFADKNKVINNLIYNKIEITFPDGDEETITEVNIASESMQLKQSICDEESLKFGGCIASEFKIDLINTDDRIFSSELTGKWISVKITQYYPGNDELFPSNNLYPSDTAYPGNTVSSQEFHIFSGFIDSAKVNKNDKNMYNIVAYDVMAKLYEWDATNKLHNLWTSFTGGYCIGDLFVICLNHNDHMIITMHDNDELNESLALYNGEQITLRKFKTRNEDWLSNQEKISYGKLLKMLCEMIGMFGTIVPNAGKGVFDCIPLSSSTEKYDFYEELFAEEYVSTGPTSVEISLSGNDRTQKIASFSLEDHAPSTSIEKAYDMTDNIVIWQSYSSYINNYNHDIQVMFNGRTGGRIARGKGGGVLHKYTPLEATLDGRLWVQPGDAVNIISNKTNVDGSYVYDENGDTITETVSTYVLSRTLTGIQALTDKIQAKGVR